MRILSKKQNLELAQASIRIPERITLDDGREIILTGWDPAFDIESCVTVRISGIIRLSGAQISQISRSHQ